jgi:hypothetical protein
VTKGTCAASEAVRHSDHAALQYAGRNSPFGARDGDCAGMSADSTSAMHSASVSTASHGCSASALAIRDFFHTKTMSRTPSNLKRVTSLTAVPRDHGGVAGDDPLPVRTASGAVVVPVRHRRARRPTEGCKGCDGLSWRAVHARRRRDRHGYSLRQRIRLTVTTDWHHDDLRNSRRRTRRPDGGVPRRRATT